MRVREKEMHGFPKMKDHHDENMKEIIHVEARTTAVEVDTLESDILSHTIEEHCLVVDDVVDDNVVSGVADVVDVVNCADDRVASSGLVDGETSCAGDLFHLLSLLTTLMALLIFVCF